MIKNYNLFVFENMEMVEIFNDIDILESIVTNKDDLLNSIKAKEVDIYNILNISLDDINVDIRIDDLYDHPIFNEKLQKKGLKKTQLESTEESETFIEDTIIIKFFTLYDKNTHELDTPKYIIFQSKVKNKDWEDLKCYEVNDDIKKFYTKLTNKTVEFKKGDKTYIYMTSNGNEWQLQKNKHDQDNNTFKNILTNNDIKAILKDDKNISITIIDN